MQRQTNPPLFKAQYHPLKQAFTFILWCNLVQIKNSKTDQMKTHSICS